MVELREDLQDSDRCVDEMVTLAKARRMSGMVLVGHRMPNDGGIAMAAQGFFTEDMTPQMSLSVIRACLNYATDIANDILSKCDGGNHVHEVPLVKVDHNAN